MVLLSLLSCYLKGSKHEKKQMLSLVLYKLHQSCLMTARVIGVKYFSVIERTCWKMG